MKLLHQLVADSAQKSPQALAVQDPQSSLTYGALDALANQLAHALASLGVKAGDRVGIWHEKSVEVVAAMQGILRVGAAYVPLDPMSPAARIRTIVEDCAMAAVVTTSDRAAQILTDNLLSTPVILISGDRPGAILWANLSQQPSDPFPTPPRSVDDLAYILYTSGSTGKPKGVMISHQNALAFVEWVTAEMGATAADKFSNHAPYHFDLTVLDLYSAFLVGASMFIIPDGMSYSPPNLVEFIFRHRLTIWYSVPTVLTMMMEQGGLLERPDLPLRVINFAGEPFPVKHLRRLFERWPYPQVRYLNLYGPTETNVCTFYEVKTLDPERAKPVPIGVTCSGDIGWIERSDGTRGGVGDEGELVISGPTVLLGYWGREPHGGKPYRTGDLVKQVDEIGNYEYLGRLDHMVKVRGYRVELGDIEATLEQHNAVHEAAVVVVGEGQAAKLVAYLAPKSGEKTPPLLLMKKHCAERLPRYMIVDDVIELSALPRTRNGKVDRLQLKADAEARRK